MPEEKMLRAVVVQLYNLPNLYRVNHVVLRPTLTHTVRVPPPSSGVSCTSSYVNFPYGCARPRANSGLISKVQSPIIDGRCQMRACVVCPFVCRPPSSAVRPVSRPVRLCRMYSQRSSSQVF